MTSVKDSKISLLLGLQALLVACNPDAKYVEIGEVSYVESFPSEVTIEPSTPVISDMEGMVRTLGSDSFMIGLFKDSPFIRIYSPENGQKLGEFISQGQGPGEFIHMPSNISIAESDHGEILNFLSPWTKQYFKMNIDASIKAGTEVYDTVIVSETFRDIKYIIPLESDSLTWHYDLGGSGLIRAITNGKSRLNIPNLGNLGDDWSDFERNTISMIPAVNQNEGMVAEAMIGLNQINLYSLQDSTFRKTICVGHGLDDAAKEDRTINRYQKRTYQGAQTIGNAFAFLYEGVSEIDYMNGEFLPQIQFFTSMGEPLLRINISFPISSFYITSSGDLYLYSYFDSTENLYRYDIPQIKELLIE